MEGSIRHIRRDVLVVDDNMDIRALLFDILDEAGCFVIDAGSGEDAIEIMKLVRPVAAIIDVMLGSMSGWEVLEELRKLPSGAGLPVVMMSGSPEAEQYFNEINPEGCRFIKKPFTREQLLEAVEALAGDAEAAVR